MALVLDPSPNFEAVTRSDGSKVSRRGGDDSESLMKLGEYLGVLKEQNKTLQKRYDNLLLLATAPVKNELEVPDDLNFLGNTADEASEVQRQNYRLCAENAELTRQHDISLRSIVELKATVKRLQDALKQKQQELAQLVAEQAAASKVETTSVGTLPAQPAFGLATTVQTDPFQRELERCTPTKAFSSWLSSLSKAECWEELSLHRRTVAKAARQSDSKPTVTPIHTKIKGVCTDDGLTPDTRAMMDRLSVLDPSTLPAPTPCTPLSAVEDASNALSPKTEAMLDFLLSPSNLPPSPPPASLPAVITSIALKLTSESQALQDSSLLLSPVAGTALRASPGSNLVCSLTQAGVEQEAVSPATASMVHWLRHPEAYPTPTQAQTDAMLLGVPAINLHTPGHLPGLTSTAKARSQVLDIADEVDTAMPQRMSTAAQSLNPIAAPVMVGRTSPASSDFAFSTSPARLGPSRADLATPAKPSGSPESLSQTPDTLSPFDFSGMLCDIQDLTESGSPAIFAGADLSPPGSTPFSAHSTCTMSPHAPSGGLDSALASVMLTASPQDLPQDGFGSPLEAMSESSTRTPASPQNWFQMKSYALSPGVDAAPAVSTPATNQTWTSPCGWGSTPSAPNSLESFGYLVTPPYTPTSLPLCGSVTPSSEQQLLHSGGEASVYRQSPARDISMRGLLQMRTDFGAEALHRPQGMLADFYPASASTTSSRSPAGPDPLVQRQLTPLFLGVPVTSPLTPSLCLTPIEPYSQVSDIADELDIAMPQRLSTAAQSLDLIAAPVMLGTISPATSDFAFSTSPARSDPSRADLATPAKPSRSPDALSKTPDTLSPFDFSGMLCDIQDLTESGSPAIFAGADLSPPASTPFSAHNTCTMTPYASSGGLDSASLASVMLTVSPQDLPQDGFGSPLETMSESSTRTPASPQNWFHMRSDALSPGVDAAPAISTSPNAGEFNTPATNQTWTSPCAWGSTPSAPNSPESFGYLVTPPYTPTSLPLCDSVDPSSEQQLLHSGGEASVDRQSPARDISMRGLVQMRTGFGAEALHHPGGILADFYPASASTTSSQTPAGPAPLVQRQLTPLFLKVPLTRPQTPSLCLTPIKLHSQVSDIADELDIAMPQRLSTAAQSLDLIAAPVMLGTISPATSDFAFSTSPARSDPSRADLATPAKPSRSPDACPKPLIPFPHSTSQACFATFKTRLNLALLPSLLEQT
ncbi:hypothetical protein ABBQ38_004839 [Trebouxia sp. C0009 RCD-2024]